MNKASIASLSENDLKDKRVFVRVDFNVPIKNNAVVDDTRIKAALPTITYLKEKGAKVILASHLGRPKGKVSDEFRLTPVKTQLEKLLNEQVLKLDDCIGEEIEKAINNAKSGRVILLENVRFYAEEEKNNPEFAEKLAKLADIYVNDAFGTAHRAHASTAGIASYLPAYAGFLMEKEITMLSKALSNPTHPFVAIIGGAKVSSKIGVLKNLLPIVDTLIISGGMTFTFLESQGFAVGKSLVEKEWINTAKELLEETIKQNKNLLLPLDTVLAESPESMVISDVIVFNKSNAIAENLMGVDIGPLTIENIKEVLKNAKTVLWNGPLGITENPLFSKGTEEIAKVLVDITKDGATTVVGGGDSVAIIEKLGLSKGFTHISTGGGASLEFLEGIELPGIKVLKDK